MTTLRLVAGILESSRGILLAATRYPNRAEVLWNLPGGRVRDGEFLATALAREFREETGLIARPEALAYVTESFDARSHTHVLAAIFRVRASGEPYIPESEVNVTEIAWTPRVRLAERLAVTVVREPLLAYLAGAATRYHLYPDAGITIAFSDSP